MTNKHFALIVAGGRGTRFGGSVPKQFHFLKGKPVLLHTVEKFFQYSQDVRVVLVLPAQEISTWQTLTSEYKFDKPVSIAEGGATRFQSVKKGLQQIPDEALVAIHDGVRPLVTPAMIAESFRVAALHRSAVASMPLKESLREVIDESTRRSRAVPRDKFRIIQTPQTFAAGFIKRAYDAEEDPSLTDDASVAERAGLTITLYDGSFDNIKITTREDMAIAEALMAGV